ncbi:MAG TPA: hypothetical protein VK054_06675 [Beutenbergiaceae bacterium]|nr:hypothetical protein [Beutenbergiaceae bacterium]
MTTRFRRPAMLTPERAERIVGDDDPAARSEVAHMTARAILEGGRADAQNEELVQRLITLIDTEGIDIVAGMWADSPATTLPGTLWRLYLLREWTKQDSELLATHFRLGAHSAQVEEVIAGLAYLPGPKEVRRGVDAVLSGAYQGDFGVTLERAGAFCRVLATGAALDADSQHGDRASALTRYATLFQQRGEEFEKAAKMWRAGRLD